MPTELREFRLAAVLLLGFVTLNAESRRKPQQGISQTLGPSVQFNVCSRTGATIRFVLMPSGLPHSGGRTSRTGQYDATTLVVSERMRVQ
jgi:hypothetical protein